MHTPTNHHHPYAQAMRQTANLRIELQLYRKEDTVCPTVTQSPNPNIQNRGITYKSRGEVGRV